MRRVGGMEGLRRSASGVGWSEMWGGERGREREKEI